MVNSWMKTPFPGAASLSFAAIALTCATPLHGQDAEPAPAAADSTAVPDRWRFGLDLALTSSSGNEDISVFTGDFSVTHLITSAYELELTGGYRYGSSHGEVVARNAKGDLKFDFAPEAAVSPFLFGSLEQDPIHRIDLRANGGAGAKYTFVRSDETEVSLSVATLYSYEDRRLVAPVGAIEPIQREGRLSWRFEGRRDFASGIRLENTTYYQPVWNKGGDYLLSFDTTARVLLNEFLAVTFGYTFERDSTPLPEVEANDSLLRAGVALQW